MIKYRTATIEDLDALYRLENLAFEGDRLSRRQLKRFIQSEHSVLWVGVESEQVFAYLLLLFNRATQLARIYSLAVDPAYRGLGVGAQLIQHAEESAVSQGYISLRLEVREDNQAALNLYRNNGFTRLTTLVHYYDDLADGVRMQKRLGTAGPRKTLPMPLYVQTLPFTCGAACLLMSFASLGDTEAPSRKKEVQLWREATTVFMAAGHGGCSGEGLALAAHKRGYPVELWSHGQGTPFIHSVRDPDKKSVIELVHQDFMDQIAQTTIKVREAPPTREQLELWFEQGACVLLLISTYRFNGQKEPHWIVLSGISEQFFYVHDPLVEDPQDTVTAAYIPVGKAVLDQIIGFGKQKHTACVVLYPPNRKER